MKVVLFCGGLGLRMREYSEHIPKPMARIGSQPIIWYLMKYYAYYGHTDFILCLGYRGEAIKEYFLNYNGCLSNDFTLSQNKPQLLQCNSDVHDWNITFVNTGQTANIGQRLLAVRDYVDSEDMFLANYSDGLSDLPLDQYLSFFQQHGKIASFIRVKPAHTFHVVRKDENSLVTRIEHIEDHSRINGGFFIFNSRIFEYIHKGEDLVLEPFQRLINRQNLIAYDYNGFWECMDTFKDKLQFDDRFARGDMPWVLWE